MIRVNNRVRPYIARMRTILITLDSLNRHFLSLYGGDEVPTPTIDSLAKDGVTFENHFTGSAPCMPARREFMTGTLELRHRSWGPLEPFDDPLPARLTRAGSRSMLITDHYHYFEGGGENYHTTFTGYEFIRGHENDNWKTFDTDAPPIADVAHTADAYERALSLYKAPKDFPAFRTFAAARDWLAENRDTENIFLYIDEFDPHEPFFAPDEYLAKYDDSGYEGDRLDWPFYGRWTGTDQQLAHIRNRYKAKVAFLDDLLGEFVADLKAAGWYEDTTIILTTDHGHYLGDHGWIGKPACDNFNTLFHIPLVVKPAASLGAETDRRVTALTTTPDLCATVTALHEASTEAPSYGTSILPLLTGEKEAVREYVLYGYYGAQLTYNDGTHVFMKTPPDANAPLVYRSTRLSGHPGSDWRLREAYLADENRSVGTHLAESGIDYPVLGFRVPGQMLHSITEKGPDTVYDQVNDHAQEKPRRSPEILDEYRAKLRDAMVKEQFPQSEFERLGLA